MMMGFALIILAVLSLLSGCSPEVHLSAISGPSRGISLTTPLGWQSLVFPTQRPAAILGVLVTHYLGKTPTPFLAYPSLTGILQQEHLLRDRPPGERGAQTSLEQLGILIQTDILDLLNRSPNRADALNAYIDTTEITLSEAELQEILLETFLDDVGKSFSTAKRELSLEQKRQNKAMKEGRFTEAGEIQERLLPLHQRLTESELKKNEGEKRKELLSEMIQISQKRLMAIKENQEIIIAGLSVKALPGIDDLGIFSSGQKRRLFR